MNTEELPLQSLEQAIAWTAEYGGVDGLMHRMIMARSTSASSTPPGSGNSGRCRRPARSATRMTTPWPSPSTARTRPSWSGNAGRSLIFRIWSWRCSGGSRGGTRSGSTNHWATGHRRRWKPSIMQTKRRRPPRYKDGTKIRPLHIIADKERRYICNYQR